jgi:hypothetical protein
VLKYLLKTIDTNFLPFLNNKPKDLIELKIKFKFGAVFAKKKMCLLEERLKNKQQALQ